LETVLLSVRPRFAARILEGTKRFEFRKTPFARNVGMAVIYATAPVSGIIGYFHVLSTKTGSPHYLWRKCRSAAGIAKKDFFDYYRNTETAVALEIGEVTKLKAAIDPRTLWPGFSAPQNYRYLNNLEAENIARGPG
jgi:predicted transcriptional regulator